MRKKAKKASIVLCSVFVLALAGTFVGGYIRGGIEKFPLPDGFSQGLAQIDSEKDSDEVRIMTSNLLVHYKSRGGSDANPRAKMFF